MIEIQIIKYYYYKFNKTHKYIIYQLLYNKHFAITLNENDELIKTPPTASALQEAKILAITPIIYLPNISLFCRPYK